MSKFFCLHSGAQPPSIRSCAVTDTTYRYPVSRHGYPASKNNRFTPLETNNLILLVCYLLENFLLILMFVIIWIKGIAKGKGCGGYTCSLPTQPKSWHKIRFMSSSSIVCSMSSSSIVCSRSSSSIVFSMSSSSIVCSMQLSVKVFKLTTYDFLSIKTKSPNIGFHHMLCASYTPVYITIKQTVKSITNLTCN